MLFEFVGVPFQHKWWHDFPPHPQKYCCVLSVFGNLTHSGFYLIYVAFS